MSSKLNNHVAIYQGDLPKGGQFFDLLQISPWIAVDTETTGLHLVRDRVLLVQMALADASIHIVKLHKNAPIPPVLADVMADHNILKIFHYARFDMAMLQKTLGAMVKPVFCTKIASRLVRTYTNRHGLGDLCKDLLGVELDKSQQSSDWAKENLDEKQYVYAANDVAYLYDLKEKLSIMLNREERNTLAEQLFECLQTRVDLDLAGWDDEDIFSHH